MLSWHFATDIQTYVTRAREQRRKESLHHDTMLATGGESSGQMTHVVELSKLPASLISSSVLQRAIVEQVFSLGRKMSSLDDLPQILFTHIALDIQSLEQLLSRYNAIVAQLETCRAEIELFDQETRNEQRSLDYTSLSKTPRRLSNADPLDTRFLVVISVFDFSCCVCVCVCVCV